MLFYVIIVLITLVEVVLFDVVLLQLYLLNWTENQMLNCFVSKSGCWEALWNFVLEYPF